VPRWMRFAPSAYTTRGGVVTVRAYAKVAACRDEHQPGDDTSGVVLALPDADACPLPLAA